MILGSASCVSRSIIWLRAAAVAKSSAPATSDVSRAKPVANTGRSQGSKGRRYTTLEDLGPCKRGRRDREPPVIAWLLRSWI